LRRSVHARVQFVESHISKILAFQIRALREREGWSQQKLAEKIGSNQNAVYRAENPNYGKQTLTTLRKIAAAFDVALVVRFVPFSELLDWVSGTPRTLNGLATVALVVPNFEREEQQGIFSTGFQLGSGADRLYLLSDGNTNTGHASTFQNQRRYSPGGATSTSEPARLT
jgi:transcriptional regulator with XRE-family HTH domain